MLFRLRKTVLIRFAVKYNVAIKCPAKKLFGLYCLLLLYTTRISKVNIKFFWRIQQKNRPEGLLSVCFFVAFNIGAEDFGNVVLVHEIVERVDVDVQVAVFAVLFDHFF